MLRRAFDVAVASAALVVTAPVLAVAALAIRLESPGHVLYRQRRVGLHGREFDVLKLRTMVHGAEGMGAGMAVAEGDPRITRVGAFLRKTRLDEIPQLWNVLRGDMSLIGPRPERPAFVAQLTQQIPYYGQRHVVKPGVTGWAQVRYAYGASVEDSLEKMQYDLYYVKHMSMAFDLVIALETIKIVVLRRGGR